MERSVSYFWTWQRYASSLIITSFARPYIHAKSKIFKTRPLSLRLSTIIRLQSVVSIIASWTGRFGQQNDAGNAGRTCIQIRKDLIMERIRTRIRFVPFLFFGTYLWMLSGMAVVVGGCGWVVVRKMGRIEIGNETKEDSGINGWWDVAFVGGRDDVLSSGLCVKWITKRIYFCPRIQRLQGAHKLEEAVVRNQNLKTSWCCGMDDGYNSRMVSRRMETAGIYCFWSVARSNWHLLRRLRCWIATD